MYRMRKWIACIMVLACFVVFSGSIFEVLDMNLGVDKTIVYQNENVETFLIKAVANEESAKKEYQNGYYVFLGTIRSKFDDNQRFYLGATTNVTLETLYCVTYDKGIKRALSSLYTGNTVMVYGKLSRGLDGKWTMVVQEIEKTSEDAFVQPGYSLKDGRVFEKEKMVSRKLHDGSVSYWIPASWEGVEKDIVKSNLGSMEGYQYCLNEIGKQSVTPESFFVCYFDNEKHLLKSGDKKETELIERAIVKNILKDDPGAASFKKTTYYGAEYHYYQKSYGSANGQNYRAEFVFQPVGTDGFVVYLYVFQEKKHVDECMVTMRLLEVN